MGDETVSEFYGSLFIATLSQILSRTTIKVVLRREYVFTVFDMCIVHLPFYLLSMSYKHEMQPVSSKKIKCDFLHGRKNFDALGCTSPSCQKARR